MDTYSNILYVKEQFAALSHLAHRAAVADKYRPETCCIIGNYYSLKGQHEKVRAPCASRAAWPAALVGRCNPFQQRCALRRLAVATRLRQTHAVTQH